MAVVGQIYAGDWLVQSGNHPNPLVTRDGGGAIVRQAEALHLVE